LYLLAVVTLMTTLRKPVVEEVLAG
jgi:hypothetical protein